jgi:hypothetical protein
MRIASIIVALFWYTTFKCMCTEMLKRALSAAPKLQSFGSVKHEVASPQLCGVGSGSGTCSVQNVSHHNVHYLQRSLLRLLRRGKYKLHCSCFRRWCSVQLSDLYMQSPVPVASNVLSLSIYIYCHERKGCVTNETWIRIGYWIYSLR